MNVAELFVTLGVKGADTSAKAVSGVKTGLNEVASSGLAAKAAIVAVVYGLQRLTGLAGAQGMELKQFAAATGLSTDSLQRWQYAARQFGVEGNEVAGTVKNIQSAMTNMLMGKGAPEGMAMVASQVGFDPKRARDTFYVMEQLQKFSKTVPPDISANILKSFGISEGMFQFFRQNKTDIDKISPGNIFSEKQIAALARVDTAWANLYNTLKLFSGGLVAQFGGQGVAALQNSFAFLIDLSKNLSKITKEIPLLRDIMVSAGIAIAAAWAPLTATIGALIYLLSELQKMRSGKKSAFDKDGLIGGAVSDVGAALGFSQFDPKKKYGDSSVPFAGSFAGDILESLKKNFGPSTQDFERIYGKPAAASTTTIQTTVYNQGVKDAKDAAGLFKKEIDKALRQMPTQNQGS